jgi:hypothetical protein
MTYKTLIYRSITANGINHNTQVCGRVSPPPTWVLYLATAVCGKESKNSKKSTFGSVGISPYQMGLPAFAG